MSKGQFKNPRERIEKIKEKRALQDMSFMLGNNNPSKRPEVIAKIKLARQKRKERLGCINLPETREKIRQATIRQFKDPKQREASRKRMIKILLSPKNSYFKDTSIEIKIQNELLKRNILFEKHKPLLKKYVVDLFVKPNIVIECDGCFYHGCSEHGNIKYHQSIPARDARKTSVLVQNKFNVYRFWEHDINRSPELCMDKVKI